MKKIKGQIRFKDMRPGEIFAVCLRCNHRWEFDFSRYHPGDKIISYYYTVPCQGCGRSGTVYFDVTRLPDLSG